MNIYELDKLATPRPYTEMLSTAVNYQEKRLVVGPDGVLVVAQCYSCPKVSDAHYSAALIVHCCNNFLKALEGLKRLAVAADGEYPATDERHPDNDGTNKLIAELENVK